MERVILLVDDEQNIISSLMRLFRREGYRILSANSGIAALALLESSKVGVILSDQRMPEMSGAEFLSKVKETHPETVRIMLSGYTDLSSVTEAINRGAIYKFLTKPWDDDLLLENVRKAFEHYEMAQVNERLARELTEANARLAEANVGLTQEVANTSRESAERAAVLNIAHEVLDALPIGVIGVGEEGLVAMANKAAIEAMSKDGRRPVLGTFAHERLTEAMNTCLMQTRATEVTTQEQESIGGCVWRVCCSRIGHASEGRGFVLLMIPCDMH